MSKPFYNLDIDKKPKKTVGAGNVRTALVFAAVAAVTCGAIWFFLPKKDSGVAKPKPPVIETPVALPGGGEEHLTTVKDALKQLPPAGSNKKSGDAADPDIGDAEKNPPVSTDKKVEDPGIETSDSKLPGSTGDVNSSGVELPKGKVTPADPVYDEPQRTPDAFDGKKFDAALNRIDVTVRNGNRAGAAAAAASLLAEAAPYSAQWRRAAATLSRINRSGGIGSAAAQVHTVRSGDSLYRVAAQYGMSVSDLRRMNNMPDKQSVIRVGQKLKVSRAAWRIKIAKNARVLILENSGKPYIVYDIGIGRAGKTPSGRFVIGDKIANPPYTTPEGRIIAPGAPENELGNYFLKLFSAAGVKKTAQGYGIHGTADEKTVMRSVSNGCIRMRNAEIKELFTVVPNGTAVEIVE